MSATILIVDDSRMVRELVRGALEPDNHRVVEASDGREALALIDEVNPDLVITDVNMPEMDGITMIRELRQKPQFQLTPVLVLTTEGSDNMKQRGREVGATGWVVKPFEPAQLRQVAQFALKLRERAQRKREETPS